MPTTMRSYGIIMGDVATYSTLSKNGRHPVASVLIPQQPFPSSGAAPLCAEGRRRVALPASARPPEALTFPSGPRDPGRIRDVASHNGERP